MKSTARIALDHARQHRLNLEGEFLPFWIGNLAAGLAAQRVSIVSGRGSGTGLRWNASFLLDFAGSSADAAALDYVALANSENPSLIDTAISLTRCSCRRTPAKSLELTLEGPDQSGFLAKLLRKLALLTLFPMEFEINTQGKQIQDRFILGGIGGVAPSDTLQATLEKVLQACLTPGG
jgi:hypothetical protein